MSDPRPVPRKCQTCGIDHSGAHDPRPVPAPLDPQVCGVCHRVPPSGLCAVCAAESLERHRPNGNAAELDALRRHAMERQAYLEVRAAQVEQERDEARTQLAALEQAHARLRELEQEMRKEADACIDDAAYNGMTRCADMLAEVIASAALQASRTEPR